MKFLLPCVVLKKFGEKNISGDMRSTCLEVVAVALSRSKDNQSKSSKKGRKLNALVICKHITPALGRRGDFIAA